MTRANAAGVGISGLLCGAEKYRQGSPREIRPLGRYLPGGANIKWTPAQDDRHLPRGQPDKISLRISITIDAVADISCLSCAGGIWEIFTVCQHRRRIPFVYFNISSISCDIRTITLSYMQLAHRRLWLFYILTGLLDIVRNNWTILRWFICHHCRS